MLTFFYNWTSPYSRKQKGLCQRATRCHRNHPEQRDQPASVAAERHRSRAVVLPPPRGRPDSARSGLAGKKGHPRGLRSRGILHPRCEPDLHLGMGRIPGDFRLARSAKPERHCCPLPGARKRAHPPARLGVHRNSSPKKPGATQRGSWKLHPRVLRGKPVILCPMTAAKTGASCHGRVSFAGGRFRSKSAKTL